MDMNIGKALLLSLFVVVMPVLPAAAESSLPEPGLEFVFSATIELQPPRELGVTKYGKRRIIGIGGGSFYGDELKGTVLPGGADWQTVRGDGTADILANYSLKTDDGFIIYVQNSGIRTAPPEVMTRMAKGEPVAPSEYYMRTATFFEVDSGSPYAWLNNAVFISTGMKKGKTVVLRFYKVN